MAKISTNALPELAQNATYRVEIFFAVGHIL